MLAAKPISDADKLIALAGQIGQVPVLATMPAIVGSTATNDLMGLPVTADFRKVQDALYSAPPPKGRDEWLPLIFAVHAALGPAGYQMARDWSASDPEKFDPTDFDKTWHSFDPNRPGGIGAGTLFHWARANGYSPKAGATEPSTGAASLLAQQPSTVAGKLRRAEVCYDVVQVPEWVIDGFNASAEITVFAGLPGVGKSTAIAALVMAVAGFGSAIGSTLPVRRTRKVALVSEHSAQYGRIFAAYCYKFSIDPEQLQDRVVCHDAQRLVKQEVAAELTYLVGQHTEEDPPLIVLDTASATFELDDENSNAEVAGMVAEVKKVVTATGAPVWIIAHAAKTMARTDADVLPRGASAYIGDAHATAAVFQDDHSPDCTFIKPIKLRHERTFDEIEVQTQAIRLQGINARGETSPVPVRIGVPLVASTSTRTSRAQQVKVQKTNDQATADAVLAAGLLKSLVTAHGAVAMALGRGGSKPPKSFGSALVLTRDRIAKELKIASDRAASAASYLRSSGTHTKQEGNWLIWT